MGSAGIRRSLFGLAVLALVVLWGGTVALSLHRQETISRQAFDRARLGQEMLSGLLEQETGIRGFMLSGDEQFLEPYVRGGPQFRNAANSARRSAAGDAELRRSIAAQVGLERRWDRYARLDLSVKRAAPERPLGDSHGRERKRLADRFRAENTNFQQLLVRRRDSRLQRSGRETLLMVLLATALFGLATGLIVRRIIHRELRYRRTQADFGEALQSASDERDANALLKRHLERNVKGLTAHVLNRNNSADRLEAVTATEPGHPLSAGLEGVGPKACMAIRRSREHTRPGGDSPLLDCEVCSGCPAATTCEPLIVGGEVIGAVLAEHRSGLGGDARRRLVDSVAQAAPVIANLRNLAIAETRAATDPLTGMPNRRAFQDTLLRMLAQAQRSDAPLALVLADLDHFKQINDAHGHDLGDTALAAAAECISSSLRATDFAARFGGEEFVLVLPATSFEGARQVAESLRERITQVQLPELAFPLTSSFGIAVYPDQAADSEQLVRAADRALYRAKASGRNRVEVAEPEWTPETI